MWYEAVTLLLIDILEDGVVLSSCIASVEVEPCWDLFVVQEVADSFVPRALVCRQRLGPMIHVSTSGSG